MLLDDILSGLGSSRSGSNLSRSSSSSGGSPTVTFDIPPLTEEEERAIHRGAHYSSDGTYERWYIDETTGRKIYTVGDKAGTWEQVQPPKQFVDTSSPTTTTQAETDNDMLLLLLPIVAMFAAKLFKTNKRKRR